MKVLLNALAISHSVLPWLIANVVVEWWSQHQLTPICLDGAYQLVWHDLWAHAAHGFGIDGLGETQAQVIQQTTAEQWCTVTSLKQYWEDEHNTVHLLNLDAILQEIKPLADEIFSEWRFTEEVTKQVITCLRYLIYPDDLW